MTRAVELAFVIGLAVSCEHRPAIEPVAPPSAPTDAPLSSDLLITLERTWCRGTCPIYSVSIDATGAVRWQGKSYVDIAGD